MSARGVHRQAGLQTRIRLQSPTSRRGRINFERPEAAGLIKTAMDIFIGTPVRCVLAFTSSSPLMGCIA